MFIVGQTVDPDSIFSGIERENDTLRMARLLRENIPWPGGI